MSDTASHGAPEFDTGEVRHTLSIHDVGNALLAAGVPRSHRQIIRYAETGMLDAVKVPGPTGDQWYVSPASIPKVVGDLKQWEAQRARQGAPRPAMSQPVVEKGPLKTEMDTASHGTPEPAVSEPPKSEDIKKPGPTEPDTSRYVAQLEKRIDEKDDVISLLKGQLVAKDEQLTQLSSRFTNLSDRFADTQKLMGVMQRMLAPVLGQADPFRRPAESDDEGSAPHA